MAIPHLLFAFSRHFPLDICSIIFQYEHPDFTSAAQPFPGCSYSAVLQKRIGCNGSQDSFVSHHVAQHLWNIYEQYFMTSSLTLSHYVYLSASDRKIFIRLIEADPLSSAGNYRLCDCGRIVHVLSDKYYETFGRRKKGSCKWCFTTST